MNYSAFTQIINLSKPAFVCISRSLFTRFNNKQAMSTSSASCHLVCLQRSHDNIPLPDGVTVNIGRSPATKIVDPRCSRNQVALTSNWAERKVKVQQLGGNPSCVDGTVIGPKKELEAGQEATIFILEGEYPHKVVFSGGDTKKKKDEKTKKDVVEKTKISEAKNDSHSSSKTINDKENGKKAQKRPSSSEEGILDAKKKRKSESHSENQNSSLVKKQKVEGSEKMEKYINEDDEKDAQHVSLMASKLEAMKKDVKKDIGKDKSTMRVSKEQTEQSKSSPSLSSSLSPRTSSSSSLPSSSTPSVAKESGWTQHEHLHVFTSKGVESRKKIAGFDVDGTIILTKSGKTFPEGVHDWKIAYPEIFAKLKQMHKDGFKIVFFTNQLGVARGKIKIEELKVKLENIVSKLQVPVQVFVATHEGKYRKPVDGMWRKLKYTYNGGVSVDSSSSVFVGDAAGRPVNFEPKRKKDFSSSDRLFALNIGVDFKTPEEIFLNHKKAPFTMPAFDPRKLSSSADMIPPDSKLTLDEREVIVLVGFPASGKSHFAKHHLKPKGYVVVNRDTLGSWQKCVKVTSDSLVNFSVVVDNTNMTKEERKRYLDCAKTAKVPCRCFSMTTTFEHCKHNEKFREMTDSSHAKINPIIFNQARSKFTEPSLSEGFSEIVKVNFVPKFSSSTLAADYKKFIVEK